MRTGFPGFPREGVEFLRALARNNRREWFQPRKQMFEEQVKQPMRALVETVNTALMGFAPELATEPEKAIYRIYRDTRFSKDKTPYKTHIAASFHHRPSAG
ncbi:MAG: TIGR02453 family protein, partial [Acidobacteriia bacterium]|nr:TIGR02453 family protein [Terriglobia bacterium]